MAGKVTWGYAHLACTKIWAVSSIHTVSEFKPLDLEVVQRLFDDCQYPVGVTRSQRHEWLERPNYVHRLVVFESIRIVGHVGLATPDGNPSFKQWAAAFQNDQKFLVVTRLLVSPDTRMVGLATQMMNEVHRICAANDTYAALGVIADNRAARALYHKLGYRHIGNAPYTSMNGTPMEKALYVRECQRP